MHAARLDRSPRLQATLAFLRERGRRGATTREVFDATGSMACHSDVSELRANGYGIACRMERETATGRRVYRYILVADVAIGPAVSAEAVVPPSADRAAVGPFGAPGQLCLDLVNVLEDGP